MNANIDSSEITVALKPSVETDHLDGNAGAAVCEGLQPEEGRERVDTEDIADFVSAAPASTVFLLVAVHSRRDVCLTLEHMRAKDFLRKKMLLEIAPPPIVHLDFDQVFWSSCRSSNTDLSHQELLTRVYCPCRASCQNVMGDLQTKLSEIYACMLYAGGG